MAYEKPVLKISFCFNPLKLKDFLTAFENSGLNKKVLDTMLENFYYCVFEMKDFVQKSYLTTEYKTAYCELLDQRAKQLFRDSGIDN